MVYVVQFILGTIITYAVLMMAIPVAQKLGDFGLPPFGEMAAKLAAVAISINIVDVGVGAFSPVLAWILGAIVFWTLMVKWFQVDFFGALVIVGVTWFAQMFIGGLLLAAVGF